MAHVKIRFPKHFPNSAIGTKVWLDGNEVKGLLLIEQHITTDGPITLKLEVAADRLEIEYEDDAATKQ